MSEQNPIRVYVSHCFGEDADYFRVFEYLESNPRFFYVNCSAPDQAPQAGGKEAIRDELRKQVSAAEVVIILSAMYEANREWITFQMDVAGAMDLPIIAMEPFGVTAKMPDEVRERAEEVVEWNERFLIDALRRQARHEDTTRWEVVEFEMP
jgi:Thoeris protein ThsB, TIR-like domain